MAKKKATSKKATNVTETQETIDLSKVDTPQASTLSDRLILDTIQEMVLERAKENPKHPHVGVNEIADKISESTPLQVDGADVRKKLQKIRKVEGYKRGKTGQVEVPADHNRNPYEKPLVIQWADLNNRQKGIEYLVTFK